ncbi:unnamed protein product [Prunus armeniaca]
MPSLVDEGRQDRCDLFSGIVPAVVFLILRFSTASTYRLLQYFNPVVVLQLAILGNYNFPSRVSRVFFKHKVSRLKLSDLGLPIVVGHQLLLVGGNLNNGLFSFFFEQIKVDFHLLTVLVKTAHLNAHGRDCDVWRNDCFCPIGVDKCYLMPYFPRNAVIYLPTNYVPLSITIDCGQPNLQMMCRRHRSHQVNGPLHEWPWTVLRMVFLSGQAMDRLVALASITSSSILRGVLAHGRLEIADAESLLSKRSALSVISTFAVAYLAENLERLRVLDPSEMRAGV